VYANEVRVEGTLAWRNNNPGNIRPGQFAQNHGAIGSGGGFAIFPDEATGSNALLALLQTPMYQSLTITNAIFKYAPPTDNNNTQAYVNFIRQATGLNVNRTMSSLSADELNAVAGAIRQQEGWTEGTIYTCSTPSAPSWVSAVLGCTSIATGAVPTVTGISPNSGPPDGGVTVVITGTGFTDVIGVAFGQQDAAGFSVDSDTQISAASPIANLSGAVDVTVTTGAGTSATGNADQFTFVTDAAPPSVTGLSPTSGPTEGGTQVTITGSGFTAASSVAFGAASPVSLSVDSDTQITTLSPTSDGSGAVAVTVTTSGGTSTTDSTTQFSYAPPPTVTAIDPTTGPSAGGTQVTISGSGFTGTSGVTFGSSDAPGFTVVSDTEITVSSPAANVSGAVDVSVMANGVVSDSSPADQFTYT
jgi:hypothetical protein